MFFGLSHRKAVQIFFVVIAPCFSHIINRVQTFFGVDKISFAVYTVLSDRVADTCEACDRGSS